MMKTKKHLMREKVDREQNTHYDHNKGHRAPGHLGGR